MRFLLASFLTKYLLLPWQRGLAQFYKHLLDGDQSANALGWQWTSGSNTDAFPFSCLVNPVKFGLRQDPLGHYIRRWLPELRGLPTRFVHEPWKASPEVLVAAGVKLGDQYPERIVKVSAARNRARDAMVFMRKIFSSLRPSRGVTSIPVEAFLRDWPEDVPELDDELQVVPMEIDKALTERSVAAATTAAVATAAAAGDCVPTLTDGGGGGGATAADERDRNRNGGGGGMYYSCRGEAAADQNVGGKASLLPSLWSLLHFDEPPSSLPHASPTLDQLIAVDTACLTDGALVLGTDSMTGDPSIENALLRAHAQGVAEAAAAVAAAAIVPRTDGGAAGHGPTGVGGPTGIGGDNSNQGKSNDISDYGSDAQMQLNRLQMSGLMQVHQGRPHERQPSQSYAGQDQSQPHQPHQPHQQQEFMDTDLSHQEQPVQTESGAPFLLPSGMPAYQPVMTNAHGLSGLQLDAQAYQLASGSMPFGALGAGGIGAQSAANAYFQHPGAFPQQNGAGTGAIGACAGRAGDGSDVANAGAAGVDPSVAAMSAMYAQIGYGQIPYALAGAAGMPILGGQAAPAGFEMSGLTAQQQQQIIQMQQALMSFGYGAGLYGSSAGLMMDPNASAACGASAALGGGGASGPYSQIPYALGLGAPSYNAAGQPLYFGQPTTGHDHSTLPQERSEELAGQDFGGVGVSVDVDVGDVDEDAHTGGPPRDHPATPLGGVADVPHGAVKGVGDYTRGGNGSDGNAGGGGGRSRSGGVHPVSLPASLGAATKASLELPTAATRVPGPLRGIAKPGQAGRGRSGSAARSRVADAGNESGSSPRPATATASRGRGRGRGRAPPKSGGRTTGPGSRSVKADGRDGGGAGAGASVAAEVGEAPAELMALSTRKSILAEVLRNREHEYYAFAKYLTETYSLTDETDRTSSKDYIRLCTLKDDFHRACSDNRDRLKIYKVKAFFSNVLKMQVTGEWDRHGHGGIRGPWVYGIVRQPGADADDHGSSAAR
jgi:hypothetical protein